MSNGSARSGSGLPEAFWREDLVFVDPEGFDAQIGNFIHVNQWTNFNLDEIKDPALPALKGSAQESAASSEGAHPVKAICVGLVHINDAVPSERSMRRTTMSDGFSIRSIENFEPHNFFDADASLLRVVCRADCWKEYHPEGENGITYYALVGPSRHTNGLCTAVRVPQECIYLARRFCKGSAVDAGMRQYWSAYLIAKVCEERAIRFGFHCLDDDDDPDEIESPASP